MRFWDELKRRARIQYHINVFNHETFAQRADFTVRLGRVWGLVAGAVFIVMLVTFSLVAFTPLREVIPGYTSTELRERQTELVDRLDQLQAKIAQQDSFIKSIQRMTNIEANDSAMMQQIRQILAGGELAEANPTPRPQPAPTPQPEPQPQNTAPQPASTQQPSPAPALVNERHTRDHILFIRPVEGRITRGYDPAVAHYAIDIASAEGAAVKSIAPGVVIFADYTLNTGFVIAVRHAEGYISFYKHNRSLLRSVGSRVSAGDPLAIVGNSGEQSTGPHLHFELWHEGLPVNPTRYLAYQ
jgi:murein DD-endopeptidase MepM/ murein hydrolase activator NlpD